VDVEWTEVAGEQEYRVEIYSESQRGQPQAWTVKQPSVTVSLAYGETYWITVEAVGKEEEVKTSFRILRREKAEELQRLARQYARSHLLRGIFYEENGLFRKARAEYRAMSEENPDSPLAREIYQQLEKSLEPGFVFTPTR
jgi:tetratricopeptide (TPR) repeat protein